jgi:hypothetical protein
MEPGTSFAGVVDGTEGSVAPRPARRGGAAIPRRLRSRWLLARVSRLVRGPPPRRTLTCSSDGLPADLRTVPSEGPRRSPEKGLPVPRPAVPPSPG